MELNFNVLVVANMYLSCYVLATRVVIKTRKSAVNRRIICMS